MKITLRKQAYNFLPWKPPLGRVFRTAFAFDCETTLIDEDHPWIAPPYVIGAGCDGQKGYFVRRADVAAFFAAHVDTPVVFHNAPFDLSVINALAPQLDVYQRVDEKLVWDTLLLHRLYVLGTAGHTAGGKGESDLEHCAEAYIGVRLPKDVKDSKGKLVRLSYGMCLNRPPHEVESVYLE
jgi:hypothetical protein